MATMAPRDPDAAGSRAFPTVMPASALRVPGPGGRGACGRRGDFDDRADPALASITVSVRMTEYR
jgi:hypothetical protein